jgi:hypothetical protein
MSRRFGRFLYWLERRGVHPVFRLVPGRYRSSIVLRPWVRHLPLRLNRTIQILTWGGYWVGNWDDEIRTSYTRFPASNAKHHAS